MRRLALLLLAAGCPGAQDGGGARALIAKATATANCTEAIPLWREAEKAGTPQELPQILRKLGICLARGGDSEGALEVYTRGRAASIAVGDTEMQLENGHGMAVTLRRLGRTEEAFGASKEELALAEKCGHPEHLVPALQQLSFLYSGSGKAREGLETLQRAADIARQTNFADVGVILSNLGNSYIGLGEYESVLRMANEELGEPGSTDVDRARIWNNIGEVYSLQGKVGEAREAWAKGLSFAGSREAWGSRFALLYNLAFRSLRDGLHEESIRWARDAVDLAVTVKNREYESRARNLMAEAMMQSGDRVGAAEQNAISLRLGREIASPHRVYEALATLGEVEELSGRLADARRHYDEALEVVEAIGAAQTSDPAALRGVIRDAFPLFQQTVLFAVRSGNVPEALHRAEQAKARALTSILATGTGGVLRMMTPAEREQREAKVRALSVANREALRNPSAANTARATAARLDLSELDHAAFARHPELRNSGATLEPLSQEELAELLPSRRRVLLDYFTLPDEVALFAVRLSGHGKPELRVFRIDDREHTLGREIAGFRAQLASRSLGWVDSARRLYGRLVAPAASFTAGATEWIVSPDGDLWQLPFAALAGADGKPVVERNSISYTPSLSALREIRRRPRPTTSAATELLIMGNPAAARAAAALPESAQEVAAIRAVYPARGVVARTGAAATAKEFTARAPGARVIHVASHSEMNNADPLYSALLLSPDAENVDGEVLARQMLETRLRADLVILSACETGLGRAERGEGMLGLGWSLTAAGASASVLSHWKVDSAATRDLMVVLHRALAANSSRKPRAELLREAMLSTMEQPAYRHPFYWAAFSLLGDGY